MDKVIRKKEHIYLVNDQEAYIIPIRSFQDEVAVGEFYTTESGCLSVSKSIISK